MTDPRKDLADSQTEWFKEHRVETYKSLITVSMEAFKYLALLNGGAAAGMLANSTSLLKIIHVGDFRVSLTLFSWGLACSAVAMLLSWCTQYRLHGENLIKAANTVNFHHGQARVVYREWHRFSVFLALCFTTASVLLFAWGAIRAAKHIHG